MNTKAWLVFAGLFAICSGADSVLAETVYGDDCSQQHRNCLYRCVQQHPPTGGDGRLEGCNDECMTDWHECLESWRKDTMREEPAGNTGGKPAVTVPKAQGRDKQN